MKSVINRLRQSQSVDNMRRMMDDVGMSVHLFRLPLVITMFISPQAMGCRGYYVSTMSHCLVPTPVEASYDHAQSLAL